MGISVYSLGDSIDQDPPKNLHLVQVPKSGPEPSLWQGVNTFNFDKAVLESESPAGLIKSVDNLLCSSLRSISLILSQPK